MTSTEAANPSPNPRRLCIGIVTGAHGVKGAVRVKSFTADPADLDAYGPVSDAGGTRRFGLRVIGMVKGSVLAEIEGVTDRDAAEALKGLQLHVERDRLPPPEPDEFYHADLIGLRALLADGTSLGRVTGLHDFGAGESVEIIGPKGETMLVPFTRAAVPEIDLTAGTLTIEPPAGLFDKPAPPAALAEQERKAAEALGDAFRDARSDRALSDGALSERAP
jgi:16S rRNA processing protein RimM